MDQSKVYSCIGLCVMVMCLYFWSLGAIDHDTPFTEKQAYYDRIGEISACRPDKDISGLHGFFHIKNLPTSLLSNSAC